jgi:hypothetical protein
MGTTHKIRVAVGSMIYVKVRFDLYKVFDCCNNYVGMARGVGENIFCS